LDKVAIDVVEEGFTRLAQGEVTLPPIMRIDVPEYHGEVDVKTAYIHGWDDFAIKVASGFFKNRDLGLPSGSGMMLVVSAVTGYPKAILLDNGYLTDVRTGAAGAIAARYLAREKVETAGVIGAGAQARYQMRALRLVRDFKRLMVFSLLQDEVERYADDMENELDVEVVIVDHPQWVVRESEVVVTATPSRTPYLRSQWLHPGLHITCMGSDAEGKQEVYPDVIGLADLLVCDQISQCYRLGELHHALEVGVINSDDEIIELGELAAGVKVGRQSEDQITVCDLTGVGVQDTAIALLAYKRALERGLGMTLGKEGVIA
jgi:ornithine cyclodeaminase